MSVCRWFELAVTARLPNAPSYPPRDQSILPGDRGKMLKGFTLRRC